MSKETITIGWLSPKYEGGGVPMEGIMLGLNPQRYRVICIYLKKTSDKPNRLEQKGYKAYYISRKEYFRIFNVAAVWRLSSILRQEKVDILHCQRHQATIYGSIAAKLAKTPVVLSHVHGLNRSKRIRAFAVSAKGKWHDSKMKAHVCPGVSERRSTYAMNPNCKYDSPLDMVLLFETKAGWNQHGGPELFTFDNHDPKGGCVLLNDGTVKFIRTKEELQQFRWK